MKAEFYVLMVNRTWEKSQRRIPQDVHNYYSEEAELAEWFMETTDVADFPHEVVAVFFDEWVG